MTRTNAPPTPTHRTDSTGGRSKTKHRSRSKRLVWRVSSRPSEGPSPLVEQPESNAVVHRPLDHRRTQAAKKSFAEPLSSRDLAQRVKEPPDILHSGQRTVEQEELTRYATKGSNIACEADGNNSLKSTTANSRYIGTRAKPYTRKRLHANFIATLAKRPARSTRTSGHLQAYALACTTYLPLKK